VDGKPATENPRPNNRGTPAAKAELVVFGRRLRRLRDETGRTQAGLADDASVHRVTLVKVETGMLELGVLNVARLAAALGVPPGALFGADGAGCGPGRGSPDVADVERAGAASEAVQD
jgi:transcriptional regulator with XRE-family HTH domain